MFKCFLLILFSFEAYSDIPIIGIDHNGREIDQVISKEVFVSDMEKSLHASFELLPEKENLFGNFFLEKVSIGFGAHGEIGFGPFKIGGAIRHRYFYLRGEP